MHRFQILIYCLLANQLAYGAATKEDVLPYKKNSFGDIFLDYHGIPAEELSHRLISSVESLRGEKAPFILEVPHEKAAILDAIKSAGFSLFHADNNKTEWILRNGSGIPAPYTAVGGAQVIVLRNGKILAIEEKTRRGLLSFPGGTANPKEAIRTTAARELFEEVKLTVQPDALRLISLRNRLNCNKQGASEYNHLFLTTKADGEAVACPQEVEQVLWIPVTDLLEAKETHGLRSSPLIRELAKHIYTGAQKSYTLTMPDCRQWTAMRDPSDVMNVDFFQQDLE